MHYFLSLLKFPLRALDKLGLYRGMEEAVQQHSALFGLVPPKTTPTVMGVQAADSPVDP